MNRNNKNYFGQKNSHTYIKHEMLHSLIIKSLAISNHFRINDGERYSYIDLYAGEGVFEDGEKGSPLLVKELISSKCFENGFSLIEMVFVEKEERRAKKLLQALKNFHTNCKKINQYIGIGYWEDFEKKIQDIIIRNQWGFIFADPFANEIDMAKFQNILEKSGKKDILIFINLQSTRRLKGSSNIKILQQAAKWLEVSIKTIKELDENKLRELLLKKFQNKIYNLIAAIPNSRNNQLTNSDYFALCFLTNSIGMADAFLETYENIKKNIKGVEPNSLFAEATFENKIVSLVKKNISITLMDAVRFCQNDFLSWKTSSYNEIPKASNILATVNNLLKSKRLTVHTDERYKNELLSSRNGTLKKSAIQTNQNLKRIRLMIK